MPELKHGMTRAVIAGGCGFIGSRLANALAHAGVDVTVFDIASPPPDLDRRCTVEERDTTDPGSIRGALATADVVFLLAANLAKLCEEDPARGWDTNVIGTANVLREAVLRGRRPRIVFASSAAVYDAETAPLPVPETAPLRPVGLYAASKLAGEQLVAAAAATRRLSAVIFRPFSVYGHGPACGARGHFVAGWLERAASGLPLTIFGDGSQTVDLTYVDDAVIALCAAAYYPLRTGLCATYNLGGGAETPVRDVARWISEAVPSIRVDCVPPTRPAPVRQLADLSRVRMDLGYEPRAVPEIEIKRLAQARIGPSAYG